jgi:competence protein ComEC
MFEESILMKQFGALALTLTLAVGLVAGQPRSARAAERRNLDIFFVDVDGGAATLFVTPAGESVLIDSGWPGEGGRDPKRIEGVAKYVAGVKQIDHYFTTHWHTDHYGGISELAKLIPVKHYYDHGIPAMCQDDSKDFDQLMPLYKATTGGHSTALKAGDIIPLRTAGVPIELKIVSANGKVVGEEKPLAVSCARHGKPPVEDESDNMRSLGIKFSYGDFTFLDLGDLTWNIEHKLACPKNRVGKVDLWQVTHHGWQASSNPALVDAIQPSVAIMVNGAHKGGSPSVIQTIRSRQIPLYQLHKQLDNKPEENTSADKIANMEEKCNGEFFRVTLAPDGKHYTLFKGEKTPLQTFAVR